MSTATKAVLSFLILVLVSIWAMIAKAPDRNFHLSFLNVGQGDSILIQSAEGNNILVDGGPGNQVLTELGNKIPFYNRKIDAIYLTHPHADHLFGLIEVIKRYQVEKVYITGVTHTTDEYLEFLSLLKEKNLPASSLKAGDQMNFGSTEIKVLWPTENLTGKSVDNINLTSLVLEVRYQNTSALLLGDLEKESQIEMMKSQSLGNFNILKVAHHGSADGFSGELLEKIRPKIAVISVGADNRYGHPAFSTISGLESRGIEIFRTDRDGTIEFISDGINFRKAN